MIKVEIVLDKEKIFRSGEYDIIKMLGVIDSAFEQYQLPCEIKEPARRVFAGRGTKQDFSHFGIIISRLKEEKWFLENAQKWLWYNSDNGRDEKDFAVEDILDYYRKKTARISM